MGSPNTLGSLRTVTETRRAGAIAIVALSAPPVNALSEALRLGIRDGVAAAEADPEVAAIVLIGAGRMFCGGADITEFGRPWQGIGLGELLDRVEDCAKPVVAAIHGMALGGGLELALACHYRLATPAARLGQPEVKLGLVPGAGGTQRLPRLVGTEKALEMIVSGEPVDGRAALDLGLLDALADEEGLEAEALAFAGRLVAEGRGPRRVREDDSRLEHGRIGLFAAAREAAARRYRGFEAPQACIACVEAAGTLPFAEALAFEERTFFALMAGAQSIAQRHAFFAEREAAKIPDLPADARRRPVRRVALAGADLAGAAFAGAAEGPARRLAAILSQAAGLTVLRAEGAAPPDFAGCDLVLVGEARDLASHDADPEAILAVAADAPDPAALAEGPRPERMLGLHPGAPLPGAPSPGSRLLEILRGPATAPEVLATALSLARGLGRVAVVTRGGFIGPRMLGRLRREAGRLVHEGASPEQVARVLTEFGLTAAPLGLDAVAPAGEPAAGHHRRAVSDDEILERCLDTLVDAGARILEAGGALRASDIDVVWLAGYGWPAYRGGPMHGADAQGLPALRDRLRARADRGGPDDAPAPLIERLAAEGGRFADLDRRRG
ncbi:enoyl-CoA hydratase-related protein [Methylobacterium oxalidis]|uniref:enoyl-CoA hydratase-related protein n=1 Tax=Methylobacterium oxalidis TaxID=944322 RepID=UPI00331579DD